MKKYSSSCNLLRLVVIGILMTAFSGCEQKETGTSAGGGFQVVGQVGEKSNGQPGKGTAADKSISRKVVEKGSRIRIKYTGMLNDGTVFDRATEESPLEFVVGEGKVIPGLEKVVVGMRLNEEREVYISAKDANYERSDDLIVEIPKSSLPEGTVAEKGTVLTLKGTDGNVMNGTIISVTENSFTVDANHPMAGLDLIFVIKILEIN
jgi:FKBP-type peptidyl-prolyl cis-trans isomerase 2